MEVKQADLKHLAEKIESHQTTGQDMDKVTIENPSLTVEEAYEIQKMCINYKEERGDRMIGWKMGLTSKAKQVSVGVDEPIYGRLTQSMELSDPVLPLENLIHPRVEPEIAFVLKKELSGEDMTPRDVWMATECIFPAIEVIDSRYKNFSFTLVDVIADNASSTKFILGDQAFSPYHTAWDEMGVAMFRNGELLHSGTGAAVLGHPVRSVAMLAKMLSREGQSIKPGQVILVGGFTEAVDVSDGDHIEVRYDQLGALNLRVEG
ncbi:2-keto-4-pentenoate hydratase [Bacillus sp. Marseille-Q3570]|uniref:2-keto-4-pentenoate hydratase n=1 Tax=Bacillus sp. Marseille-Q3570 TaxID=2963522 RepID=UPI0021B7C919|nr:fumarylacetoacetate hydrolase family protein [Bacillus sp. Marseille-Q3570]